GKRQERGALALLPLVERRGIKKEGAIERLYQSGQLLERQQFTETFHERRLYIAQVVDPVEQRDDEVRTHSEHDGIGRHAPRIAQAHQRLPVLLDWKRFDRANFGPFHRKSFTDAMGFEKLQQANFLASPPHARSNPPSRHPYSFASP